MEQKINVLLVVMRSSVSALPGGRTTKRASSGKERRSAHCQKVAHHHRCRRRLADRRFTRDRSRSSARSASTGPDRGRAQGCPSSRKAVPAAVNPLNLCLTNSIHVGPQMCQVSNGAGQPVTIGELPSTWAAFHNVRSGTCGGIVCIQLDNGSGNCLRAGTNHVVKIENGSCVAGDDADWWQEVSGGGLQSWQYGDEMLTHGSEDGFKVLHAAPGAGDWTNWSSYTA